MSIRRISLGVVTGLLLLAAIVLLRLYYDEPVRIAIVIPDTYYGRIVLREHPGLTPMTTRIMSGKSYSIIEVGVSSPTLVPTLSWVGEWHELTIQRQNGARIMVIDPTDPTQKGRVGAVLVGSELRNELIIDVLER